MNFKFDENFLINLKKDENIDEVSKSNCKVLKISSEWTPEDALWTIHKLNPQEWPCLFVFTIDCHNFQNFVENKQYISSFDHSRPIILQLISGDEKTSQIYVKEETVNTFVEINQEKVVKSKEIASFSSFLQLYSSGNFEDDPYNLVPTPTNCSLTLRFLRTLEYDEEFFATLVLRCAADGTKEDMLAILDAPFRGDGRILSMQAQKKLELLFDYSDNNQTDDDDDAIMNSFNNVQQERGKSVLFTAVEHRNAEIIDYLITYWSHLLQQLPFDHQVRISTAAFETEQLDVLCDLLDIADFPFPKDFNLCDDNCHDRLGRITSERMKFHKSIEEENFEKIDKFIDSNLCLKLIFSTDNITALTKAVLMRKFTVFYYLKSLGFQGEDCDSIFNHLNEDERRSTIRLAVKQRKINVERSLVSNEKYNVSQHKSVSILAKKSRIHNRRISKEQESEYRKWIVKWLEDIKKIAPELINVAATCEDLKIIFDFESESAENMILSAPHSLSATYPISKWIFIGAKISVKEREQRIKGVLAHELCHYVMHLVYENHEHPYHEHRHDIKKMFEEIVEIIDKWSSEGQKDLDDECSGNISSVFKQHSKEEFQVELIVRVVQILTEFCDDLEKLQYLQEKYKNLFNFWYSHVIPELQKYLQRNLKVIKLNQNFELLKSILKIDKLKVQNSNIMNDLNSKKIIITSNVPRLLLVEFINYLKKKDGILFDSRSLFVDPEKLKNDEILMDFKDICQQNREINIFVDCTKGFSSSIQNIVSIKEGNLILVVQNETQRDELLKYSGEVKQDNLIIKDNNYNWSDLTEESQHYLLRDKINFHNNCKISLLDLFCKDESDSTKDFDFSQLIDDQALNFILENQKISNNAENEFGESFNFLCQSRKFVRNKEKEGDKLFVDELISEVKDQKYVLIADVAGNGKSWAMKNLSQFLHQRNLTNWVSYVDLKQFKKEFKTQERQKDEPEFSIFMAEKILRPRHKFESEIFQKLYKDGKVFILFDGFDEIAPNYAEFVSNLAQSFQSNGGNQLWIATRDYFEVDLMKKLKLDVTYGLQEMTEDDGIDLVAESWILKELYDEKSVPKSRRSFKKHLKGSTNYQNYQDKATKIVQKVLLNKTKSVKLPQLFEMITDAYKDEQDIDNLNRSKIYEKFINNLYIRWSHKKGKIREAASIESQKKNLNFFRVHQFYALLSRFPEYVKEFFPHYDEHELPAEELIACGILTIKDGKKFFILETFRDFFFFNFIAQELRKSNVRKVIFEILIKILTNQSYSGIQIFLNELIEADSSFLIKHEHELQKFAYEFCKMDNFDDYFNDELVALTKIITDILKMAAYENVKNLLTKTAKKLIKTAKRAEIYKRFEGILSCFLTPEDLKELLKSQEILHKITQSKLDAAFNKNIEFHQTLLTNNFRFYDNSKELQELICEKDFIGFNYLNLLVCGDNVEAIELAFTKFKKIFSATQYDEILKQRNPKWQSLLQIAATSARNAKTHQILWKVFKENCKSDDEFIKLIEEVDNDGNNALHLAASFATDDIFKFMIEELEKIASSDRFRKLLITLNNLNQNLLQLAANHNESIGLHKILWTILPKYFEKVEMLEFIKHVDKNGNNILGFGAFFNSKEIFELIWNQISNMETLNENEQKKYLQNSKYEGENLLEASSKNFKNPETYELIRFIFQKYEIVDEDFNIIEDKNKMDTDDSTKQNSSNIERKAFLQLIDTVRENNLQNVLELLQGNIDVNCVDSNYLSAIDYGWINYINPRNSESELKIIETILMQLLKSNSKFPNRRVDFDYDKESEEIKDFIDFTDQIKEIVKQYPNLKYFVENNNEYILLHALRKQKFIVQNKINSQLLGSEISNKMDIDEDSSKIYNKFPENQVLMLLLRSKIGNARNHIMRWNFVEQALTSINEISSCSKILKIVASWKELKIYFDFETFIITPNYQSDNLRKTFEEINIPAKDLMNEERKFEVYGTIIHELCHLAFQLTYMNNCNPYPNGESRQKQKYVEIFKKIKNLHDEKRKMDGNIKSVFECYSEDHQHSELIVRPVQIVINYKNNLEKLHKTQKIYNELFDYVEEKVIPEFEIVVPVLKKLQNRRWSFKFDDLTEPLKLKILHSKVIFQGRETTFFEIIGNDFEILKLLSSQDIRKILLKNEILEFGINLVIDFKQSFVARNFILNSAEFPFPEKTYKNIAEDLELCKNFVLSDCPGAGKTTVFEQLSVIAKENFKSYGVFLLKLENYREILRKNKNNFNDLNSKEFVLQILKINKTIEIEIFNYLYKSGKLILFFDGYDEIAPEFSKLFLRIFKELREDSKNHILISTRTHHSDILDQNFKFNSYKFLPFTKDERIEFLKQILKDSSKSKTIESLESFLDLLDRHGSYIDNPLTLRIIAELIFKNEDFFNEESLNLYKIIDAIVDKIKENLYVKIPFEDNLLQTRVCSSDMHIALALKNIFQYPNDESITNDIYHLRNWKKDESKWTADKIQRFGFVTKKSSKSELNFTHKSFADFFVAQYFISSLFCNHNSFNDKEFKKVFELLRITAKSANNFEIIQRLIFDYVYNNQDKEVNNKLQDIIFENRQEILKDVLNSGNCLDVFKFWLVLLPVKCAGIIDFIYGKDNDELSTESLCKKITEVMKIM